MERIEVFLTPAQHKKLLRKESFQLSAAQLKASDRHIGHKFHVELQLTKQHYKKLLSNVKAGKGYRFSSEAIVGSGFLDEMWNGAKKAVGTVVDGINTLGQYIPADTIRTGVKTGLTGLATAAGTMIGNPELGLLAAPLIDRGVDYAERGYNYLKDKPLNRETAMSELQKYRPQIQNYVEERVPMARRAREYYDEYAPRVRKVYRKARKVYYQEPDDEDDDDDDEEDYAPPPPPRRKKKAQRTPQPYYSPPAEADYSGYRGRGLKKGQEMKPKMAKLRAMRKGGAIETREEVRKRFQASLPQNDSNGLPPADPDLTDEQKEKRIKLLDRANVSAGDLYLLQGHNPNGKMFTADMKSNPYYKGKGGVMGGSVRKIKGGKFGDKSPRDFYNSIDGWEATTARTKGGSVRRGRKIQGGWNPFNGDDWNNAFNPDRNGLSDAAKRAAEEAQRVAQQAADAAQQAAQQAADAAKQAAQKAQDDIVGVANQIGDSLRGAADNVVSFYQKAASTANSQINQAFAEVAKTLPSQADAVAFGKQLASALIHQGIPQATAAICGALAEAAFPEGGPVSAQLGSQLGQMLGEKLADEVGNQTGYGLRRRHRGHLNLIPGGTLRHGVPSAHISEETRQRIMTHGLAFRHKGVNGLHKGGSFASPSGS